MITQVPNVQCWQILFTVSSHVIHILSGLQLCICEHGLEVLHLPHTQSIVLTVWHGRKTIHGRDNRYAWEQCVGSGMTLAEQESQIRGAVEWGQTHSGLPVCLCQVGSGL
jgi:hypothetical protein